ncbi:MAG: phosphoribosyltransferase family protein [Flavobacteriales bacterium]|nr:phosphoribosyltransferase family protein [Flavobacteriales bacterium]MCX7650927.1 phosphoribosyltransferase family protein [Flavobacteriales bacterium]MDW8432819.1 phosphoribosyltransferase family protein [Flavobacteriales bacterium]
MRDLYLHDKIFEPYISKAEIDVAVNRLASEMVRAIPTEDTVFICVLKGAFMFFSDLMKQLGSGGRQEFIFAKSYAGTQSTGKVWLSELNADALSGQRVVLVEDIVDTGLTVNYLAGRIQEAGPLSLHICTFLFKAEVYRGLRTIDFKGLTIPNYFVVGYGLDYEEKGRSLPEIFKLKG